MEKLETDLRLKDAIVTDYKAITAQLSAKLDKLQPLEKKALEEGAVMEEKAAAGDNETPLEKAMERVRMLELELAQTKLALVETECKNQDLTHHFNAAYQVRCIKSHQRSFSELFCMKRICLATMLAVTPGSPRRSRLLRRWQDRKLPGNKMP